MLVEDTRAIRGMIAKVSYLLEVQTDIWDFTRLSSGERSELRRKGDSLSKLPMEFATPVYIADHTRPADAENINNGTGTLVEIDGRRFCVTNSHVLDKYRQRRKSEPGVSFQIGNSRLNPFERLVAENRGLDLVVIHLDGIALKDIALGGEVPTNFKSVSVFPTPLPKVGDYIMFGGYPKNRRRSSGRSVEFGTLSSGAAYVYDSSGLNIVCQIEKDRCYWEDATNQGGEIGDLGGISGGPALMERATPSGLVTLELVGFVYEYGDAHDVLLIRPARFLARDGTLRNPDHTLEDS